VSFLVILIVLAGLLSFFLTGIVRKWAIKYNVISHPSSRSINNTKTPQGGGLAIIIVWYLGILLLFLKGIVAADLFYALLCGLVLAVVSLIDDVVDLNPLLRLIIHFVVSIAAFYILGGLRKPITSGIDILSTPFLTYPLAIIGMVWFINLYNFMDGADGFASIEAISVSLVLFISTGSFELLLLLAAVLGFLYWNWPKAKIFLGDVGSTQLGFILVVLGIYYHNALDFSIFNWLMITAPFWFDATLTLFRRWRNGESLGQAHKKHIYQRYLQAGHTHLQLDMALIVINVVIFILILIYRKWDFTKIPIYLLCLVFLYWINKKVDKMFPFV